MIDFKKLSEDIKDKREVMKPTPEAPPPKLSDEQQAVLDAAELKHNILITGSAGVGKSELYRQLCAKAGGDIASTASTGVAAVNIQGVTINSWAGLGMGDEPAEKIVEAVQKRRAVVDRIRSCNRLAIDEISMVNGHLFDKLDHVLRTIRKNPRPFGGIQIIAIGDFLQLPPVSRGGGRAFFAFQSEAWKAAGFKVGMLRKVWRQSDVAFSAALNDFRTANLTLAAMEVMRGRYQAPDVDPKFEAIDLHTTNVDVNALNLERLAKIDSPAVTYTAEEWGDEWDLKALDKNCLAPRELELKVGAQVMLLKNLEVESGLANGTIGKVVDLPTKGKKWQHGPTVEFRNGQTRLLDRATWSVKIGRETVAERIQIPLRLAYAITVHKAQGMSLDKIRVHLGGIFEDGQAYVALSRARTLDGLFIQSTKRGCVTANRDAVRFYEEAERL